MTEQMPLRPKTAPPLKISRSPSPPLPDRTFGMNSRPQSSDKVGVVGRTGSRKSTLLLALYRMFNLEMGSIVFDGVDIAAISLQQLRRGLSVIPQVRRGRAPCVCVSARAGRRWGTGDGFGVPWGPHGSFFDSAHTCVWRAPSTRWPEPLAQPNEKPPP